MIGILRMCSKHEYQSKCMKNQGLRKRHIGMWNLFDFQTETDIQERTALMKILRNISKGIISCIIFYIFSNAELYKNFSLKSG